MKRIFDAQELNVTGRNIKAARLAAKISQQALSAKLETEAVYICRGSIARLEAGQRLISDLELQAIAKVLGVDIQDLFEQK